LSDGLASDLPRMCAASGCGASVQDALLPDHAAFHGIPTPQARRARLAGGDDYQLLMATPPNAPIAEHAHRFNVEATRIGTLVRSPEVHVSGGWPPAPFRHFGEAS